MVIDQRRSADGKLQEIETRLGETDDPLVFTIIDGDGVGEQAVFWSGENGEIELLRFGNIPFTLRYGTGDTAVTDESWNPERPRDGN